MGGCKLELRLHHDETRGEVRLKQALKEMPCNWAEGPGPVSASRPPSAGVAQGSRGINLLARRGDQIANENSLRFRRREGPHRDNLSLEDRLIVEPGLHLPDTTAIVQPSLIQPQAFRRAGIEQARRCWFKLLVVRGRRVFLCVACSLGRSGAQAPRR